MATVRIDLGGRDDAKICVKVISDFTDTLLYRLLPALLVLLFSTVTMDLTMGKLLLLFPSAVELCCVQTRIISCHIKLIYTKAVFPQWKFWNADACATESSTATGRESVTPLMRADLSAMLTGGFFMHPFFVMPILKDCGRQAFCWVSDTDQIGSNILINHPFSSDTTCGDVRAQYFFVWGVSNPKSSILVTCHWQGASGLRYLSNEACDASTDLSGYARNSWKLSWTHPYIKYIYHISHISMNYISKTVQ